MAENTENTETRAKRRDHAAEWKQAECALCGGKVDPSTSVRTVVQDWVCEDCARRQGILVKCPGHAHKVEGSNRCPICAPRWGWVLYTRLRKRKAAARDR